MDRLGIAVLNVMWPSKVRGALYIREKHGEELHRVVRIADGPRPVRMSAELLPTLHDVVVLSAKPDCWTMTGWERPQVGVSGCWSPPIRRTTPRLDGMPTLREEALRLLITVDPLVKAAGVASCSQIRETGADKKLVEPAGIPGRPARPVLVSPSQLKARLVHTMQGRASLIHSLAHIELNAIDLALDLVWRFPGMGDDFYFDWMTVASEEAMHFTLLREHLANLGYAYGDFPAHNALWEMAERTRDDLLARIALVPRTLEARGLDAAPPIRAKLAAAGDHEAAAILDIILRDEVGHVAVGNRWYRLLCQQRGLEPIKTYSELAERYRAPRLRGPFNIEARLAAGFDAAEIEALSSSERIAAKRNGKM